MPPSLHDNPFAGTLIHFRVLGIPVHVEAIFLVATFFLAGGQRTSPEAFALWLAVVFVSILVHELGHALVGRHFGLTPQIRLYGWGGLTSWAPGDTITPARDLAVALAGPAVGIVCGGVCLAMQRTLPPDSGWRDRALADLVWVNLTWGALNLVPLLPLDGGNAFSALCRWFAPGRAAQAPLAVSAATGVVAGALALHLGYTVPGVVAGWLGIDSARRLRDVRRRAREASAMERLAPTFAAALEARDGAALVVAAEGALREGSTGRVRTWILEHLAIGHALTGAIAAAARALAAAEATEPPRLAVEAFVVTTGVALGRTAAGLPMPTTPARAPHDLEADDPWLDALATLRGSSVAPLDGVLFGRVREAAAVLLRDAEAARLGERLLDAAPDPDLAFALACTWARAGDRGRAGALAALAVELGFRDWERAAATPELATLAGDPALESFERARRHAGGA